MLDVECAETAEEDILFVYHAVFHFGYKSLNYSIYVFLCNTCGISNVVDDIVFCYVNNILFVIYFD